MEKTISTLTVTDIISVYSGIDGKCCCGCSGKHYYHAEPTLLTAGALKRGYAVSDDEISPRMIKKVLKLLQTNESSVEREGDFVSVVIGDRLYTAYLIEGVTCSALPPAPAPTTEPEAFVCDETADRNGTSLRAYCDDIATLPAMHTVFGAPRADAGVDEEKGYTGDEWVFRAADGRVFTVYARFGAFRIGGRTGVMFEDFKTWLAGKLASVTGGVAGTLPDHAVRANAMIAINQAAIDTTAAVLASI